MRREEGVGGGGGERERAVGRRRGESRREKREREGEKEEGVIEGRRGRKLLLEGEAEGGEERERKNEKS